LGCLANLDKSAVNTLPNDFKNGVYGGIARVDDSPFFPMVMSIGYNVQFDSTIKTIVSFFSIFIV
jgi:FAD synthase